MKILVYGCKKMVEEIANFLEIELPIEVEQMVCPRDFTALCSAEIVDEAEGDLRGKIGEYDLIVLADPLGSITTEKTLRSRYPRQKFVSYCQGLIRTLRKMKEVCVLVSERIKRTEEYQAIKARCQQIKIREENCVGWIELIKNRHFSREGILERVKSAQGAPILVLHPDLPLNEVREVVDWHGEIVEMDRQMLADIKTELDLKI